MNTYELEKLFAQLNLTKNHFKSCRKITPEGENNIRESSVYWEEHIKHEHARALADYILTHHPDSMLKIEHNHDYMREDTEYTAELFVFTPEEFKKLINHLRNNIII
jgi:hypothetical protein